MSRYDDEDYLWARMFNLPPGVSDEEVWIGLCLTLGVVLVVVLVIVGLY